VLPIQYREEAMRSAHASISGGHMGVKKTQDEVAMMAYWVGWQRNVREYCLKCDACARYHRGGVKKRGELQSMCVGAPWERLAFDITSPHPLSGKGNRFIITVIDHFTKYAFAFPVRNHEARTVAKYLVEKLFLIHGVLLQFLSDRIAEFEGHIFQEICELLGVDKLRITAYKPSTNGALERMHRTLNAMLGKIVDEKQKDWDVHVAYVMTAYNATVHSATGFTPNRLVFGEEMRYPNELMYVGVGDKTLDDKSYSDFVEDQRSNFRDGFDRVRESLGLNADKSKKMYDMKVRPNVYAVGDWVFYFCPRHRMGRSPKWQNFYSGPYLIVEILGTVNVRIQKTAKASAMVVHVDKLKMCKGETPESWIGRPEEKLIDRIERGVFITF